MDFLQDIHTSFFAPLKPLFELPQTDHARSIEFDADPTELWLLNTDPY